MLVVEESDVPKGKVAVEPESIRFPPGCLVCERTDAVPTAVRFTRTLLFDVIAAIETIPLEIPLCPDHKLHYEMRMRAISIFQIACVAIAALSFGYLFILFGQESTESSEAVFAIIGIVAVVLAYLSIRFRATALPVTLRPRAYGRIGKYGLYVFRFDDLGAAERFAAANRVEVGE